MERREFLKRVGTAAWGAWNLHATPAEAEDKTVTPANTAEEKPQVLAFYFPQFHPDPRNDQWHGKGWTEWELVKAARPRYPGHRQPIVPAWGYFDESDPTWAAKEIALAADHGMTGFLYDWYWYEDGPFLQAGLERGFLKAANRERLQFAVMWANHDWLNIHPATFVNRPETLASGKVSRAAFDRMTDYLITHYFSQPNHLKIAGRPVFSLYELGTFLLGMGGLAAGKEALAQFRAKTQAAGHPGLHLNVVVWGLNVLPSEIKVENAAQVVKELGFDSVTSYTWIHHYNPNADGFPKGNYANAAAHNYKLWEDYKTRYGVPYFPHVSMGWDSSPRTIQSDRYENRGYPWTAVLEGNTPEAFRTALQRAKTYLDAPDVQPKILTLNAWNEWTEGSYLLPDTVHGTAYLQAIKSVFG